MEVSLLSLASEYAANHPCVRGLPASDEAVLDSICQFDALAVLAAIAGAGSLSTSHFYPNFARFYTHRTEPAFVEVLDNQALRAASSGVQTKS